MPNEIRPLPVGTAAPDFTLKDHLGKEFKLSALRGKRVMLSFHPLAWTGVCANQAKALDTKKPIFDSLNTIAVGISVDSVPSKKAWADDLEIKDTRMLADFWPHGAVARLYGVFREEDGLAQRSNFVIDENGKVVFSKVYDMDKLPDIEEIIGALKKL
ncbi:MAG: thioredoxin peroxidase [Chloroflexi bacterium RBG_16_51_9]|nr:MAG: thioredoxin peroxidase [Chloroflexi bacterium RBG_16_51_9]